MFTASYLKKGLSNLLASTAIAAFAFAVSPDITYAKSHKASSHDSGESHDDGHDSGRSGKKKGQKGKKSDSIRGSGNKSLRDIFHEMEDDEGHDTGHEADDQGHSDDTKKKQTGKKTVKSPASDVTKGKKSDKGGHEETEVGEDEDSDRPEWAGVPGKDGKPGRPNQLTGVKKGDLYGDMYVLLRDENGVPIYTQLPDGTWVVQPVDADGVPIPLDEDGHPTVEGVAVEVELGRSNVARAPLNVLEKRYDEVLKLIADATAVTLDAAGRLVFTIDGEEKTIDSPLENLAIYVELMNQGTLTDVANPSIFTGDLANLVDGTYTIADLVEAKSFLAAAVDKTGSVGIDNVEYLGQILGIDGTLTDKVGSQYVDYSAFTYDREATYIGVTADVLVQQSDGSWVATTVNIYDAVFSNVNYDGSNVEAFAQASDDARAVIEFIHEYALPADPSTP